MNDLAANDYHEDLDNEGDYHYDEEQLVVAEVLEDVPFIRLELPRIDLVEDLQEDECVEDYSVVQELFGWLVELWRLLEVTHQAHIERVFVVALHPDVDLRLSVVQLRGEVGIEHFAYIAIVLDARLPVVVDKPVVMSGEEDQEH